MVLLLAFSLQDQVEKYGSYVGIAAFFGLAVLSLLYFAQAREVKRLREWAGRAPERAREVEERAIAQAEAARRQPAPAARPVAKPIAAATAAGGRSGTVSPAVPVGAATAVVERPDEDDEEEPIVYGPPTEDGKGPVPAIEPPPKAEEDEPDQPDADEDERDEEEPAAVAPATNGAPPPGAEPPAIPRPSTAAAAAGVKPAAPGSSAAGGAPATAAGGDAPSPAEGAAAGGGVPPNPAARPVRPAAAQLRQTTSSASPRRPVTMPPRRPGTPPPPAEPAGGHRGRSYAIAGGIAAVVVALGVLAATQFLGNGDDKPNTPNQAASPTAAATDEAGGSNSGGGSSSAPTSRADTTVAVFNGTTISGLAAGTADKLRSSGYKRGTTGDYTDQQRASSTVFYTKAARRQAREIGRELNISELRVMDAETQALAGQNADVAVVVGSDKAP
jgi:hypothetical protein